MSGRAAVPTNGHDVYTPAFLRIYDPLVLGFYARFVWRVPKGELLELYERHLSARHLDVGPGTGWFLERTAPGRTDELVLLDANTAVLDHAGRRLADLRPETVEADVLEALPLPARFSSVGASFLLHCLPGPPARKAAAVRHMADVLEPDGVLFGATVLGEPARHTRLGCAVLGYLNKRGIFSNLEDTAAGLHTMLSEAFHDVDVRLVGSGAVFTGSRPRRAGEGTP
jgi:SAM-dependent methyltransferase